MSLTYEQFKAVEAAMSQLNERQKDYFVLLCRRMLEDPATFSARMDREGVIFQTLLAAENYKALDRWFARGRLRLVKSDRGGVNG